MQQRSPGVQIEINTPAVDEFIRNVAFGPYIKAQLRSARESFRIFRMNYDRRIPVEIIKIVTGIRGRPGM